MADFSLFIPGLFIYPAAKLSIRCNGYEITLSQKTLYLQGFQRLNHFLFTRCMYSGTNYHFQYANYEFQPQVTLLFS